MKNKNVIITCLIWLFINFIDNYGNNLINNKSKKKKNNNNIYKY